MSMIFIPDELKGKVNYIPGSVAVNVGVILTEEEQKIFDKLKQRIEFMNNHRSEYLAE